MTPVQNMLPLREDDVALPVALRLVEAFRDLSDDDISWLASLCIEGRYEQGDVILKQGDSFDYMTILLEGEIQARSEGNEAAYSAWTGMITGALPYSRMTKAPRNVRAVVPTRVALLHRDHFEEVLERIPVLRPRLVSILADRVRESAKVDLQREKLTALGKLSAGLAHELNNPAAAARRAVSGFREALDAMRRAGAELETHELTLEQRRFLAELEEEAPRCTKLSRELAPLERSDLEDKVTSWLDQRKIENSWELAPVLVDSCGDLELLEELASHLPDDALAPALRRTAAVLVLDRLVDELEDSVGRIANLVDAIKRYTYMDRAPEQLIDLHQGIESTLTMLQHELKRGIKVTKHFASELPSICANGGELNQVWTNLIENAIDAMNGHGEIQICTSLELDRVLIEITDSGPGIPPEIQNRIFEPFFTTKPVGEGTGLGLDFVSRIIRRHHGEIRLQSRPGATTFQIYLPVEQPRDARQIPEEVSA
jgi:signal transduction histidine kinase